LIVLIINIHQGSPKVILMISSVLTAERS